jgi:biotin transport system permease protein/energy-coupling factor transport system permease protein
VAVERNQAVFKYKTIKGILHKIPAAIKLFLFPPLCIFCLSLNHFFLVTGIITLSTAAFLCRLTSREQLTDMKPAFFYFCLMYALSVFSYSYEYWNKLTINELVPIIFTPKSDLLQITLRLVVIIQLSALLFRTTSSLEIRESLRAVEKRILSLLPFIKRKEKQYLVSESICLFICFIPEIFSTWSSVNLAWKARSGKQGVKKIKTTVFVLISLSMEKAALKAKAYAARTAGGNL